MERDTYWRSETPDRLEGLCVQGRPENRQRRNRSGSEHLYLCVDINNHIVATICHFDG